MGLRRSYEHLEKLVEALRGIRGAPDYRTDLGGRVYLAPLMPEDRVPMPFLAVPNINVPIRFPEVDETWVRTRVVQSIYGFVAEGEFKDTKVSTGLPAAWDLVDDIVKALARDWKLGGSVHNSRPGGEARLSHGINDRKWVEVVVPLELELIYGPLDIGP